MRQQTREMVYLLTFFDFLEHWWFHVSSPGACPVCAIFPHQTKPRIAENTKWGGERRRKNILYLAQRLTIAGVIVESFHFKCFLRSVCNWWADVSLCSMKLMAGGMWENSDCRRAGESVKFGVWEVFKTVISTENPSNCCNFRKCFHKTFPTLQLACHACSSDPGWGREWEESHQYWRHWGGAGKGGNHNFKYFLI